MASHAAMQNLKMASTSAHYLTLGLYIYRDSRDGWVSDVFVSSVGRDDIQGGPLSTNPSDFPTLSQAIAILAASFEVIATGAEFVVLRRR